MACKDCTCYVDGHSKNGGRLPAGQGLCTMYNQDVSAGGNCSSCMSVNDKGSKKGSVTHYSSNGTTAHTNKPRKGMKAWAIVCFVFAGIYALIALGVGTMMFGMTAFLCILGVMLLVLYKSPKHIPYLFGKSSGMTKTTFVIICIAAAFCSFALIAGTSEDMTTQTGDGTNESSTNASTASKVTSIGNFKTTEYELFVGESVEFSLELRPKDLTAESVGVEVSDNSILSVSDIAFTTEGRKTILTFKCTVIGEGEATIVVKSITGDKTSNTVSFKAEHPPIVTAIGKFSPSYAIQEVGDQRTVTVYMKPIDLTMDDFVIENSDETIISVSDIALATENEQTVLTFTVTGIGVGKASITIKGADGKTESNALQFTINEKDTSRTVYVTPYGEKYHYSAACAGSNATATTENKAARSGKERCKKCG